MTRSDNIETVAEDLCFSCGCPGRPLYQGVIDRLFDVPGQWNIFRCPACESAWINPRPIDSDVPKLYKNYYTHSDQEPKTSFLRGLYGQAGMGYLYYKYGYGTRPRSLMVRILSLAMYLHPGRSSEWASKVFYTDVGERGSVLEIGCGTGATLKQLSAFGWNAEGIDLDEEAVRNAKSKGLKVYQGDLCVLNLPAEKYDLIALSHVIEHVADIAALLSECHRLLKPGGRFVAITPNSQSFLHRIFGPAWLALDPPRHLRLFTRRSLAEVVGRQGFAVARCVSTARAVRGSYFGSVQIAKRGKLDIISQSRPGMVTRLRGEIAEIANILLLVFNRNAGEDLVIIARKNPSA